MMSLVLLFLITVQNVYGVENISVQKNVSSKRPLWTLEQNIRSLIRPILPKAIRFLSYANISTECERSFIAYGLALIRLKPWSIQMIDASSKIPSGLLTGTQTDFGAFDECLRIRVNESSRGSQTPKEFFRGQYCTVAVQPGLLMSSVPSSVAVSYLALEIPKMLKDLNARPKNLDKQSLWLGICVPSACSEDDMESLSLQISEALQLKSSVIECLTDKHKDWSLTSIAAVCLLCCLIFLCIFGTAFDAISCSQMKDVKSTVKETEKSKFQAFCEILKTFSILKNSEELFKSTKNDISCFQGIRILTALWIILGHTYFYPDVLLGMSKQRRLLGIFQIFGKASAAAIIENFSLSTNTFFVLSGYLLVKTQTKLLEKNKGKLNILNFICQKYWRMTPALGFALLLLFIMPELDSAPLWNSTINPNIEKCKRYWWTNFLYINNWVDNKEQCYIVSWYLAALMQMHIIGFCLITVIYRWKLLGIFLGALITFISSAVTVFLILWRKINIPVLQRVETINELNDYGTYIYFGTNYHITSYFVGMILAYVIEKYGARNIELKYRAMGWFVAAVLAIFCFFSPYLPTESRVFTVFYMVMHRALWSVSVGWLIYSCVSGFGGIVNHLLSLTMMQPLGKLSFLIYLTHPLVIIYKDASSRERTYYGHSEKVFLFFSTVSVSLIIAYVGYVAVEAPFSKLGRIVFRRQQKETSGTFGD